MEEKNILNQTAEDYQKNSKQYHEFEKGKIEDSLHINEEQPEKCFKGNKDKYFQFILSKQSASKEDKDHLHFIQARIDELLPGYGDSNFFYVGFQKEQPNYYYYL